MPNVLTSQERERIWQMAIQQMQAERRAGQK